MRFKHYYSSNIRTVARSLRATDREGVMGIGAESYTSLEVPDRRFQKVPKNTIFEQDSKTKRHATQMASCPQEEDDNEPEVVVVSSSIIRKRKSSITPTPGTFSKRVRTIVALSDEPKLPDSEPEEEICEDKGKYDNGKAVDVVNKQRIAQASKDFDSACRSCRINANKALKTKYELQISKLKSEHRNELRDIKAEKSEILSKTKIKASDEKAQTKTKYEKHIKDLKSHLDRKVADLVDKHKEATERWQDKDNEYKKKIKAVTGQRDEAEAKRKEIERSAADDIRDAKNDFKAGERKLREEKKQMLHEKQQAIDILKPQHSIAVKEKERVIKDLTQNVVQREKEVKSRDYALHRLQTNHDTLQQQHKSLKTEYVANQTHTKQLEKDLNETKKYFAGVEGRADARLVRVQEKLELQETDTREHANRVISLQRENYILKDTVNKLARLGREKKEEVERLKAELQSTKAELGVVKDMEEMGGGFE